MASEVAATAMALLLSVTTTAPAPVVPAAAPAVASDWAEASARPSLPSEAAIKQAVRDVASETPSAEPARRHEADTLRGDKYDALTAGFADAKVPGCLRPDGLKRQPTFIFNGLLALPFIAVAAIRGKCN